MSTDKWKTPKNLAELEKRIEAYFTQSPKERRAELWRARVAEEVAVNARQLLDIRVWVSLLALASSVLALSLRSTTSSLLILSLVAFGFVGILVLAGSLVALIRYKAQGSTEKAYRASLEDAEKTIGQAVQDASGL